VVPAVVEELRLEASQGHRGRLGAGRGLPQADDLALELAQPPLRLARALELFPHVLALLLRAALFLVYFRSSLRATASLAMNATAILGGAAAAAAAAADTATAAAAAVVAPGTHLVFLPASRGHRGLLGAGRGLPQADDLALELAQPPLRLARALELFQHVLALLLHPAPFSRSTPGALPAPPPPLTPSLLLLTPVVARLAGAQL